MLWAARAWLQGARLWIPAGQIDDPVTSLVTGLPLDLVLRTKGQLAIDICTEAFAGGTTLNYVCGTRSTALAPNCASSSKRTARAMCCGSRPASTSPWPDQPPPPDRGMVPLTVPEIRHLLVGLMPRPSPPGHADHWLDWKRRHQARARWYDQRTRLAHGTEIALVS